MKKISKRAIIIGQAPPAKATSEPFARTRLFDWFLKIGISKEYALNTFTFMALVNTFPGKSKQGHRPPSPEEIHFARPFLMEQLRAFKPDILLPVGTLAIRESLCDETATLATTIGKRFFQSPFGAYDHQIPSIPLPHPSGASPWIYSQGNGKRLDDALQLIAAELTQ